MEELRIDPEFQGKLPPLTDDEFDQLKKNIIADGRVKRPIVVWNGTIIDGHHRWKIIQENPWLPYEIEEKEFSSRWEAIVWMIDQQCGQRNLTEVQRTILIGEMQTAQKYANRAYQVRGEDGRFQRVQNAPSGKTSEQVAEKFGVSSDTVKRAEKYADGYHAIRGVSPDTADKIISGKLTPTKADIIAVGNADEKDRAEMIRKIEAGKRVTSVEIPDSYGVKVNDQYNGGGTREYREKRQKIAEYVAGLYSTDDEVEYTVEDMLAEIGSNAESFLCILRNMLNDHETLVKENIETVTAFINEKIINEIMNIERSVEE